MAAAGSADLTADRLVVVLGYASAGEGLHEICAARVLRAQQEASPHDAILLSGSARRRNSIPEAELMARSWNGRHRLMFLDRGARSTYQNVAGVAELARRLDVSEVILVTSAWHARRASALLTWALDDTRATLSLATTDERATPWARFRELVYYGSTRALVLSSRAWPSRAEAAGRWNDIALISQATIEAAPTSPG